MGSDLSRRNQNLYYTYHKDKVYTTKQCRVLKDHLEQLVRAGYLKKFVVEPRNQETRQVPDLRGILFHPLFGVIEVIHATSRDTLVTRRKGVLTMVLMESC